MEESRRLGRRDGFGAISFGVFLTLIGAMFVIMPDLYNAVIAFFKDFRLVQIIRTIWIPAPISPNHPSVYLAVEVFCYLWGLFQILILVLRFSLGSPIYLKAKTSSRIIFWLGAGWLAGLLRTEVLSTGYRAWFAFWSAIAVFLGLSLVLQGVVLAATAKFRYR